MQKKPSESQEMSGTTSVRHIAFIMDGNGRWAKKRLLPREAGHKYGAEVFRKVMRYCCERGILATTFYVFSTENWKRPQKEVDSILDLLEQYLNECERELEKYDIRFVFLGNKKVFSPSLQEKMLLIEERSRHHRCIVNLALNYGGRDELVNAFQKLAAKGKTEITEQDITDALYTADSPELDLIVRTGGDFRISNFLLWQAAYAELFFTDTLWPDLTVQEVEEIIEQFQKRNRRFGGVENQLKTEEAGSHD